MHIHKRHSSIQLDTPIVEIHSQQTRVPVHVGELVQQETWERSETRGPWERDRCSSGLAMQDLQCQFAFRDDGCRGGQCV